MDEKEIIQNFLAAEKNFNSAEKQLEDIFIPKIKEAIEQDDVAAAKNILKRMPSSIAKVLARDIIHNHKCYKQI